MKRIKTPVKKYYFGRARYGAPYHISKGFAIKKVSLGWKDKYGTPRFEWPPQFHIYFFGLQFCMWEVAPLLDGELFPNNDLYYEMKLWIEKYCEEDINKAKETWGWVDVDTNKSTWKDEYIT